MRPERVAEKAPSSSSFSGVALAGYLLEAAGLRPVLIAVAVGYLVVTLRMLLDPALREMERSAGVAKGAAAEDSNT